MNDQIWLKVRDLMKPSSWLSQNVCPTLYTSSIARDTSQYSFLPPLSFHKIHLEAKLHSLIYFTFIMYGFNVLYQIRFTKASKMRLK